MKRRGSNALAAAAGILADRAIGEPTIGPHPLALFGRAMSLVERRTYATTRTAGAAYTVVGVTAGVASGIMVPSAALAAWLSTSARSLHEAALSVAEAIEAGRLDDARDLLPTLVGRDPEALDASGLARAVVESVAENTVDALVAPALWTAVAGAPGALAHRAVDTLDSMVGYRTERYEEFGWASARLDDTMAWVPARVGVTLVILVRPRRARAVLRAVRRDSPAHPSPNAGIIEAAFAGALGLQLGGPTVYGGVSENRPVLGSGRPPTAADVRAAVELSNELATALAAVLAGYGIARLLAPPGKRL